MNRNGRAIVATILVGLLLILTAVGLYYVNAPAPGSSAGQSLIVSPVGGSLFDQFTGAVQPPRIVQIAGISGSSGGSSGGGTTPPINPPGNNAPVSNAGLDQTVNEGVLVTLDGTGSFDPDSDPLTYSWTQTAGPGVVLSSSTAVSPTFTAPSVTASTVLIFQLAVGDGSLTSVDTVTITVNDVSVTGPTNFPPQALDLSLTLNEDSNINFNLVCSDIEGDAFTHSIVSGPSDGTLTGTGAARTYTPDANFAGTDSFTYRCNDGADGNVATVTITVNGLEDLPFWTSNVLQAQDAGANPANGAIVYSQIVDIAGDADTPYGDVLTITVISTHTHYSLSIVGNNLVISNYDGASYGETETVKLRVTDLAGNFADTQFSLTAHTELCSVDNCVIY